MGLDYEHREQMEHICEKQYKRGKFPKPLASDALPLPVGLTNKVFFVLFFTASYFLMRRWREQIWNSSPLHLSLAEIIAIIAHLASFIHLLGFVGIDYVQNFIGKTTDGPWDFDHEREVFDDFAKPTCVTVSQVQSLSAQLRETRVKQLEPRKKRRSAFKWPKVTRKL
eukprot:c26613_g1_i1 orf=1104-1607(+)